ncbi:GlxA family transcriptional regulator [Flavobacterium beibuense]|uniref:Transcriptional regulator, AraC family n=1 Tax=Flavobacterium beibuense TaxID=657326 RepID=A0A444W7V3_9FLAO|nr:helix-turn-helix domain-containing protein [Flavobacterium beibuense]RYJ41975.1 Transcriptional regulator, AraC family [Flavobacterium beibuense]
MQLGILLTKDHRLLSVAAILDVFESVNRFYTEENKKEPFTIELLYMPGHETQYPGYVTKATDHETYYDIILIPSFRQGWMPNSPDPNFSWIPWLQHQYREGAAVASFCTGAFLLASTGLLDNKPATTHINAGGAFARAFPKVVLQTEAVVTEKDRVYTSGGATNSFHLMMLLLEVYCSRKMAVKAAKVFSVDMDRNRQTYFGTFSPAEDHGDDLVKLAQEEIRKNFSKGNTIEEIITDVPASRRNLVRRFKQVTGITPIEYLQKTRIEAAKQLLEQSRQSIVEVMYESGYNDLKTFRSLFKKTVGMTPKMYRDKFSGQMV